MAKVVNVRDVDRMAREMQAVEHDMAKLKCEASLTTSTACG